MEGFKILFEINGEVVTATAQDLKFLKAAAIAAAFDYRMKHAKKVDAALDVALYFNVSRRTVYNALKKVRGKK